MTAYARSHRVAASLAVFLAAFVAGCGGGGNDDRDQLLSIEDGTPAAYTVAYLDAHPNLLVQPEHMIIARLDPTLPDGDRQSVRLHVREPMTLTLDSTSAATAVSEVTIEDEGGRPQLLHHPGDSAATASLRRGAYRIVFQASPGLAAPQTLFLKLADTPSQATRRSQATPGIGAPSGGLAAAAPSAATPLGAVSANACLNCIFDGADLSNQDLSGALLGGSTFRSTTFDKTIFQRVWCYQCVIEPKGRAIVDFTDADLGLATLTGAFSSVTWSGASLMQAALSGDFRLGNFKPSATRATSLKQSDLTHAVLGLAELQYADLSGAKALDSSTFYGPGSPLVPQALRGVISDNMTPTDVWASASFGGMDLTGASFAGMDMSHADLSATSGTKITIAGILKAILTNGTTGTNFAGQDFGTAFAGWAGKPDGTVPGADLRGVNLSNTNLYEADLTGVNLDGAALIGADLTNASLKLASLKGAQLGVAPDSGAARAANLTGAYMPLADFSDADLRSVKFANAHVYGTVKFVRARLDSASLVGANLANADFTSASLANADFTNAVLVSASFSGAVLQNATMQATYLQGASFLNTTSVAGLSLVDAYVSSAAGAWSFKEADGTPYTIAYAATALGDLATNAKGIPTCPDGEQGPCSTDAKLHPSPTVPYPAPPPQCIPVGPNYDNCLPPG